MFDGYVVFYGIGRDDGGFEKQSPEDVKALIFFTAGAPQPLLEGLTNGFPSAVLLGLIAASTPFQTGRACTLFRGGWIGEEGAVGVALVDEGSARPAIRPRVHYPGLRTLGKPMQVTA